MTDTQRLVFGLAPFRGDEAFVLDAETAARWRAASTATTWGEFVTSRWGVSWAEWEGAADAEADGVSPESAFDFAEYLSDSIDVGPQEIAFDIAYARLVELVVAHPNALTDVTLGGSSPGGNIDVISAPLEQLTFAAAHIDADRDGFVLERDDDLVAGGMLRALWADD